MAAAGGIPETTRLLVRGIDPAGLELLAADTPAGGGGEKNLYAIGDKTYKQTKPEREREQRKQRTKKKKKRAPASGQLENQK